MMILALVALVLAIGPTVLFLINLRAYRLPPKLVSEATMPGVSVLIPARNEERTIAAAVEAALASRGVAVEVVVLDDHSEDATAVRVAALAARDGRVRLLPAPPLPEGWCGKQHACAVLARHAQFSVLAFLDADVRLQPDGLARMFAFLDSSGADLVSGVPRQETGTLFECLVLPLIHFVLLGFLPLSRMRRSQHPAYGAGCGQLFVARREAYEQAGGHAAIRTTLHDGLRLPRLFRAAGRTTDLCDATPVAVCRMYRSAGEVWRGLSRNAREGLATPGMLLPATGVLLGGQVLPFVLLAGSGLFSPAVGALSGAAVTAAYLPRLAGIVRFRQSVLGAVLHPVGVLVLVVIQWYAATRALFGISPSWKGRDYRAGRVSDRRSSASRECQRPECVNPPVADQYFQHWQNDAR